VFSKLLIANRGEIACRVMRTAQRLGVRTAAVYSEADAAALHVRLADEAHLIGPAPARESYLCGEAIIAAARKCGAEAVHPGYGFLAENAEFAEAVAAAGLVFVGPPAAAIRAMGEKGAAKDAMAKAGVAVVPGGPGAARDDKALAAAARRAGYPVLVKPAAGGGGKGLRVVEKPADLAAALAASRREAKAAFGDDRLLVERFLDRPRHVEVQVFADSHENVVHLFERECSLQRRYQKIVEETPAPGVDAALRRALAEAAVKAARAVGYVGAGTVEFLLDREGAFYFLEMNTRLQVEHTVTEMVTGQDLVEWQLRVAAGEPLPCTQEELAVAGHAIEARIYAEDPANGFLPAVGRIEHLRPPAEGRHVRVDTGVRAGDEIGVHYDPMIAKLVVWDRDRTGAIRRLRRALADFQLVGPATNLAFLAALAAHPEFAAGKTDTGFVDRHRAALIPRPGPAPDRALALACLEALLRRVGEAAEAARRSPDPYSPWHRVTGWRLNGEGRATLRFADGEAERAVTVHFGHFGHFGPFGADGYRLDLPGGAIAARGALSEGGELVADFDGERRTATVVVSGREVTVLDGGAAYRLVRHDPVVETAAAVAPGGRLTAPVPGRVVAVLVQPGAEVARGAPLMVLEAMKMEHTVTAPADGRVECVNYRVGEQVSEGAVLLVFAADGEA
jgi:3-methylcrotonyl-CoA carboxylase alpha subunit